MKEDSRAVLSKLISRHANLTQVVMVAIFIALGVNLITSSLLILVGVPPYIPLLIGLGICLVTISYLFFCVVIHRSQIRDYNGFFVYSVRNNKIIPVSRYHYSSYLDMYLDAAFSENKALKTLWDKEPLRVSHGSKRETAGRSSAQLVKEATEYIILEELSVHLSDYFDKKNLDKEHLVELGRDDIPSALLKNRFLDLFSKPMGDRHAFVMEALNGKIRNGITHTMGEELVSLYKDSGELYERFDLVLPKGSQITRTGDSAFKIKAKQFEMNVSVIFEDYYTLLPHGFAKHYLSIDDLSPDNTNLSILIKIETFFKFGILFPGKGRVYYEWVDSFLDAIDERISKDKFFESIGWDSAVTVIESVAKSNGKKRVIRKSKTTD